MPETLQSAAEDALTVVSETDGVTGARIVEIPTEDNLQITVDMAKAQALGMTPGDIRRQAATLVGGLEVGAIFEEQKVFDVQVWSGEGLRDSPEKVSALPIDTPSGAQVPLGDVATISMAQQPTLIERESVQRRINIVADVTSGDAREDVAANLAKMTLPAEYHAEVRSEAADTAGNQRLVLLYGVLALIGVLLLLQAATRNWWTSIGAAAAIPLGMVGAFVAAWALGGLTVGAIIGLLAVAVLGLHSALSVVRLARAPSVEPVDALAAAPRSVVPATVITVLAGLGVALLGARPGLESVRDMAVVVASGALTMGVVSVLVFPALAVRYGSHEEAVEDYAFDDASLYGPVGAGSHA
ncbi:hypothetical protein N802_06325 [Knoellia sinensis KCTC 19936]|uniref:RND transporter n=1 Tax=Knoellia sinensis KCTC 19936 TaxID=1385520 RepID=A0A0A0J3G9_9MICO|nr:hypothetical protein N802_06325 [Knoellia sinensis KCTC 19936]